MSEILRGFLSYDGPWTVGVLVFVILGLILGWLTTPRALKRMEADHQRALDREKEFAAEYRAAWEAERQARAAADRRVDELLELSRASKEAWESMQRAAATRGAG